MSVLEQQEVRKKYYTEAMRYIANAKDCLKKTVIDGRMYADPKYVKMACGTAYSGVLVALDGFLLLKGIHRPESKKLRKSIEHYQYNIGKFDRKMLSNLVEVYKILHLSGYYDGVQNVDVIKAGFELAKILIEKIKPSDAALNGSSAKKTVQMRVADKGATISNKKKP